MICLLHHVFRHSTLVLRLTSNVLDHNDLSFFPFSFPPQIGVLCLPWLLSSLIELTMVPTGRGRKWIINLLACQSLSRCIVHGLERRWIPLDIPSTSFLWALPIHWFLPSQMAHGGVAWGTLTTTTSMWWAILGWMVSFACLLSVPMWCLLQLPADWLIAHHSSVRSQYLPGYGVSDTPGYLFTCVTHVLGRQADRIETKYWIWLLFSTQTEK